MKIEKLLDECSEYKRKEVSLATANFENKTRYQFAPSGLVSKINFDLYEIIGVKKSDYLFIYEQQKDEHLIFVELKNSNLIKAIEQVESTISMIRGANKINKSKVHVRIVLTKARTPDLLDSRLKSFKKKVAENNWSFDYKSQVLIENILK